MPFFFGKSAVGKVNIVCQSIIEIAFALDLEAFTWLLGRNIVEDHLLERTCSIPYLDNWKLRTWKLLLNRIIYVAFGKDLFNICYTYRTVLIF